MSLFLFVLALVVSGIVGYLLGSINFAIIITKIFAKSDIRDYGSGNAGFTNVLRSVGLVPGILTLIGDYMKGFLAVIAGYLAVSTVTTDSLLIRFGGYLAAAGAVLGHMFPLYYKFKGGKGILVSAGAFTMLDPIVLILMFSVFLIVIAISKIVSLSSICAAISFPIFMISKSVISHSGYVLWDAILSLSISALVILMHRDNIKRLINKTEKKISVRKR